MYLLKLRQFRRIICSAQSVKSTSNRSRVSISPSLPSSTAVPSVYAVIAGRSSPRCHQKRKNLAMQCPEENMTEILTRNMRYRTRIYFRNA
ncbi:hypothetical protein JG687_00010759 [Phytophthora cactorum]|uniref:Uncharacterized protein n=1 Tax=Phytophthora cactorum TaxID=29920 RepID=A0A8T1UB12_9STRA|nr:hypothetical protein JG687_00010759 [Phytophthora cactorum]